ncbi:MAG TPA: MFS transporter [Terriglobales bacterium]|jgi:ACS family hexuronate transporter-like MFS transporter
MPQSTATSTTKTRLATGFRWTICALLLAGTTKNYMDRQVIGILKDTLQHQFGWNEIDYGNLVVAFQAAYALGMIAAGQAIDRWGTRIGYAWAMAIWSLASMAHGFASSFTEFLAARFALGLSESAVFPASLKAIAEWFPRKERSLAFGIANAGTNIGAVVTPFLVPWITIHWGWRAAFYFIGGLGFVWLAAWFWLYHPPAEQPRCSAGELAYIRSDPADPEIRVSWLTLLPYRQTWAYTVGKLLTDPIWWFFLFWIPDFLQREHGLSLIQLGVPIMLIYLMADVGSVAGGWLSSSLIQRGKSVNAARKIAMLICAVAVTPIVFTSRVESTTGAVLLIGLAVAAHQGFSANLFTLPSDMFPRRTVASVVGIGGTAGALGGMVIASVVGHLLQWTGSYAIPFIIAGSAYLIAIAAIHLLAPRLEPAVLAAQDL